MMVSSLLVMSQSILSSLLKYNRETEQVEEVQQVVTIWGTQKFW